MKQTLTSYEVSGKNIKKFRLELGLSQKELARHLDLRDVTISLYENGKERPSLKVIQKLVDIANQKEMPYGFDYFLGNTDLAGETLSQYNTVTSILNELGKYRDKLAAKGIG